MNALSSPNANSVFFSSLQQLNPLFQHRHMFPTLQSKRPGESEDVLVIVKSMNYFAELTVSHMVKILIISSLLLPTFGPFPFGICCQSKMKYFKKTVRKMCVSSEQQKHVLI